jgi:hypothetical protein
MRSTTMTFCLLLGLAGPVQAGADRSQPVNVDEVWESVAEAPDVAEAKRAQIARVLQHPVTRDVANGYHLDLDAAMKAVPVLDGTELQSLSQRATVAEAALAGGDKVVVSTTLIIIALLVIILILVA